MPIRATHTDQLKVEDLFNKGRVKGSEIPTWQKILFLVYLPFGVVLLIVRSFLFLLMCIGMLTLPRSIGDHVNRALLRLACGTIVLHNHKGKPLSDTPYIITPNHVSDFDAYAIWMTIRKYYCITSSHLKNIPIIGPVYESHDCIWVTPTPEGREQLKVTIKDRLADSKTPIVIYPEGGLTSGKTGTMLYSKFVFSLDCGIVPLAIKLRNPWPVESDYLGSSWGKNFFWFLILPFHVFELTYLPVQHRRENETPEEFAFRVQSITSHHLGIVPTKHTYAMKKELVKQLKERPQQQQQQQQQQKENREKSS